MVAITSPVQLRCSVSAGKICKDGKLKGKRQNATMKDYQVHLESAQCRLVLESLRWWC